MKIYNFSICYLGGDLDLVKLRNRLSAQYPGISLDFARGQNLMNVPLGRGTLSLDGAEVPFQTACHQFDSGFGSIVTVIDIEHQGYEADVLAARSAIGHQRMAAAKLAYMNNAFGVESAGDLFGFCRLPGERKRLAAERGISLRTVGLNEINIGIQEFDCYWLVGEAGEFQKPPWRDVTGGAGRLAAADNNRFWSPDRDEELYWDVVTIMLREHMAVYLRTYSEAWMGYIRQQLDQVKESLLEKNEELWAQDHEDIERMGADYLSYCIMLKMILSGQAYLRRRSSGPASLRIVEPEEWGHFSRFGIQKELIEGLVAEGRHAIEMMARPLEFREFKTLKVGVEQLESLIMLLTVLLVVMELFAQFVEPGHWQLKAALVLLLAAIPGTYILWSLTRRSRAHRRGRKIYLKHMMAKMGENILQKDEQIKNLRADGNIAPETRDHYIRMNEDIRRQIKAKEDELRRESEKLG